MVKRIVDKAMDELHELWKKQSERDALDILRYFHGQEFVDVATNSKPRTYDLRDMLCHQ